MNPESGRVSRAGGGANPPLPRGLRASGGGGGGGRAVVSLPPFWVAACGTPSWPPSRRQRTPLRRARAVGVAVPPQGWGGVRGGPWTAPPGAPADLKPPSALSEWPVVTGGSCGARFPYSSGARVAPARWCGLALRPRPPREQVQPHPPPPASRSLLGVGGVSSAPGGRRAAPVAPKLGGVAGGGWGGRPPAPPPRRASACLPLSPACPPGVYSGRGGCRAAAGVGRGPVGRRRVSAAGGGGGGGNPPALVRAPVFPRPASDKAAPFAPSWAPPVRRRPAAGRACGRLPWFWCPRTPGAVASPGGGAGPPYLRSASIRSWA